MTSSDDLIRQARHGTGATSATPSLHVAVVTCMDTRIDPLAALGLRLGQAHVTRNAGGIVTSDVIRSLIVSQRALGTHRIELMMHTRCGMIDLDEPAIRKSIREDGRGALEGSLGGFPDLEAELRRGVNVLMTTGALVASTRVRGHILDIDTGRTNIVVP